MDAAAAFLNSRSGATAVGPSDGKLLIPRCPLFTFRDRIMKNNGDAGFQCPPTSDLRLRHHTLFKTRELSTEAAR